MNLAEAAVWRVLRGARAGHKFRRHHPIGSYFADFACDQLRLIIEVDGSVHALPEVAERDALRQEELEQLGWTVLRFDSDTAVARTTEILEAIARHAAELGAAPHPDRADPHPTLRATFSQWEKEG